MVQAAWVHKLESVSHGRTGGVTCLVVRTASTSRRSAPLNAPASEPHVDATGRPRSHVAWFSHTRKT